MRYLTRWVWRQCMAALSDLDRISELPMPLTMRPSNEPATAFGVPASQLINGDHHARCATHRSIILPPCSTDAALSRTRLQKSQRRPCLLAEGGTTRMPPQLVPCHAKTQSPY